MVFLPPKMMFTSLQFDFTIFHNQKRWMNQRGEQYKDLLMIGMTIPNGYNNPKKCAMEHPRDLTAKYGVAKEESFVVDFHVLTCSEITSFLLGGRELAVIPGLELDIFY